eukprot:5065441-Heterocapsa_arctica.AAC.1
MCSNIVVDSARNRVDRPQVLVNSERGATGCHGGQQRVATGANICFRANLIKPLRNGQDPISSR